MEDIEDLLVGRGAEGAPPGFRLPLTSVGVVPRKNRNRTKLNDDKISPIYDPLTPPSLKIPGTQVLLSL